MRQMAEPETHEAKRVPRRLRVFAYVLAVPIIIAMFPYVFAREWRRSRASGDVSSLRTWPRLRVKIPPDQMNEARLRHRP